MFGHCEHGQQRRLHHFAVGEAGGSDVTPTMWPFVAAVRASSST